MDVTTMGKLTLEQHSIGANLVILEKGFWGHSSLELLR